ncbi:MAG TPA: hypothetical protein DHV62_10845 [Elusimicrobia bacterium]|nr:hypothetical protein [Elusimicrobiota bacterium]
MKKVLDKYFGTVIEEFFWRFRHIFIDWSASYISPSSINHPHRQFLIEKISQYAPFKTVLEIGCASGPNLYLLAKRFPDAEIYGIDISGQAIRKGQQWFKSQKLRNVFLFQGKADDLKRYPNRSIDIIFTDAVLIYFGPDRIKSVVREICRVARRALILNEWHSESPTSSYDTHWIHNWKIQLKGFISEDNIKITKIPLDIWAGSWAKHGYIIESALN